MSKASEVKYLKSAGWISKEEGGSLLWKNPKWKKFDKYMPQEMAISVQKEVSDFEKEYGK